MRDSLGQFRSIYFIFRSISNLNSLRAMEPMATARKVLTWLCIVPADEETTKFKKLIYIACTSALMVSTICGFLTSSAFIIKFMSTNLEDCLYALIQICATVGDTYMMLVAFILRHKIAALFDRLAAIYRASKKSVKYRAFHIQFPKFRKKKFNDFDLFQKIPPLLSI